MRGKLFGCLLLMGCATAQSVMAQSRIASSQFAPSQIGTSQMLERRKTMTPQPRGDALLRTVMLKAHNATRATLGEPPLAWDDRLAASAYAYAAALARENRFEHARQDDSVEQEGENLWMGTRDAYTYEEMIAGWIDERRFYRPLPVPDSSSTGHWGDIAHYTQIVWRDATRVGCAIANNRANDVLVCRYSPPGNVVGELPYR